MQQQQHPFFHYQPHAKATVGGELMTELYVERVAVSSLAETYGTPFFCYSANSIKAAVKSYQTAFADYQTILPMTIHYAMKANDNLSILRLLKTYGVKLDVVSLGEIIRAKLAGFALNDLVFSGVGKKLTDLQFLYHQQAQPLQQELAELPATAFNNGSSVALWNFESFDEIRLVITALNQLRPKTRLNVAVRINPDVAVNTHAKISTGKAGDKFGIAADEVVAAYRMIQTCPYLNPIGMAMHIGSQLTDLSWLQIAYQKMAELIKAIHTFGINISHADIGGGLAIRYDQELPPELNQYAKMVMAIFTPLKALGLRQLIIEPGRSLIGNAGILVTKILAQKTSGDKNILVVDAAMNDLIRPTLYQATHPIIPVIANNQDYQLVGAELSVLVVNRLDSTLKDVVGGICESGDFLGKSCPLPDLPNGSLLALLKTGAYAAVMASNYNSRPKLASLLVDGDKVAVISRRQNYHDMLALEL